MLIFSTVNGENLSYVVFLQHLSLFMFMFIIFFPEVCNMPIAIFSSICFHVLMSFLTFLQQCCIKFSWPLLVALLSSISWRFICALTFSDKTYSFFLIDSYLFEGSQFILELNYAFAGWWKLKEMEREASWLCWRRPKWYQLSAFCSLLLYNPLNLSCTMFQVNFMLMFLFSDLLGQMEPEVKFHSIGIISDDLGEVNYPLPIDRNGDGLLLFTLMEGSRYQLKLTFSVLHNIVSGLTYSNTVWKAGLQGEESSLS